ncbi:hypothetical protein ACFQ3Z_01125 [Streptomyces nogalater]
MSTPTLRDEIIEKHGKNAWDLVLTVYVNFYYSELEIIDLCARWIPRRDDLREKQYLLHHASDEIVHARLFRRVSSGWACRGTGSTTASTASTTSTGASASCTRARTRSRSSSA